MKKNVISAIMISVAICGAMLAGCSENNSDSKSENSTVISGNTDANKNSNTETTTATDVQTDPMSAAKDVAKTYLQASNAEYSETLNYLMTDDYAKQYKEQKEKVGHDHADHDESGSEFDDVVISFSDECKLTDLVRTQQLYTNAAELYANVSYTVGGEAKYEDTFMLAVEIDGSWKICFEGTKTEAYAEGILVDKTSNDALENARQVYESAEAVYLTLKTDKDYSFEYMNYISTENDKFINKIKENIPSELKDTFFTVFLDKNGVTHVQWGESAQSETMVTYPAK